MDLQVVRFAALLAGFLWLLTDAPAQQAIDEFSPVLEPLPATVLVFPKEGQGSGFVVSREDKLLITCQHVANTDQEVEIVYPEYVGDKAYVTREYYLKQAKRYPGKALYADAALDLAVIEVRTMPSSARELSISTSSARPGERTHLIGSPGGSTRVLEYVTGSVTAVEKREYVTNAFARIDGRLVLQPSKRLASVTEVATDQKVGPGFSGGPVINDQNWLIGVISSGPLLGRGDISCIDSAEVPGVLSMGYCRLASRALNKQEYHRAVACGTKALKHNPKNALAYNERGAAYSYQDRFDDAIRDYEEAIRLDPKQARTHRNLASALYHKEKYHRSVASCNDALRLDPTYARAYLTRSKARAKLNQHEQAAADYARAMRLDPSLKATETK